jgi:hypothetical protein
VKRPSNVPSTAFPVPQKSGSTNESEKWQLTTCADGELQGAFGLAATALGLGPNASIAAIADALTPATTSA